MLPWLLITACTPNHGELTLLTYNVKGAPDLDGELRPIEERLERIAPLLADYDVVGLQEVFSEDQWALATAAAPQETQLWYGDLLDDRPAPSGLGLLSDVVPRRGEHGEHYTTCHGIVDSASDCLAAKGFQVLTVQLGRGHGQLDLVNTHLEAGGGEEDIAARHAQVTQLLDWVEGASGARALLLMGDLNLRASDSADLPELERLEAVGLRDACAEVDCPEPDHIDHFYLLDSEERVLTALEWSREEHFVDEDSADLSDHPALRLGVHWERPY